jgi:predicted amidohydrolase YtcJ
MRTSRVMLRAAAWGAVVLLAACGKTPPATAPTAPQTPPASVVQVYSGGDILTMAGTEPAYAEALAVREGHIISVGSKDEVLKAAGPGALQVDLKGGTLLPGFIDGHSHLLNYADSLVQANLNPPPIGPVQSIADLIAQIRTLKTTLKGDDSTLLIGQGYDQEFLAEKRHPTAADLDAAFPTNPVVLVHTSGHMLVANTAALRAAQVTAETPDPAGGTILRKKGSREPEGLVQETGMMPFVAMLKGPRPPEESSRLIHRAVEHYASYGVTTAAEHLVMPSQIPALEAAADQGALSIDLVAAPYYAMADALIGTGKIHWGEYRKGLKYAGLKLALDGSPQGKTAFLSKPYLTKVPGCQKNCRGFANMTQDDVNRLMLLAYRNKVPVFAHCNGDAAIDMMIAGHKFAEHELGETSTDRRTVVIHSQIMRPDQLAAYKQYGLIPSFFTNHVYYWGDTHLANLGPERAAYLSPLNSALKLGIPATNHTDNIVTPLDPMFLLWSSVNRQTRSGVVLGEAERVTPYDGLRALTVNGAHQYFEEATKGTLEAGKLADLVLLDRNPLKVEPAAIKDIKVLKTVKAGTVVYTAP